MDKVTSLLHSRRFIVAAVSVGIIVAKHYGLVPENVSDEQIVAGAVLIASWILGESLRSSELKKVQP